MGYMEELEYKVQLEIEAFILSIEVMLLQRENENIALMICLQEMLQQQRALNACNEALMGRIQQLTMEVDEMATTNLTYQRLNAELIQQLNISRLRQQQQMQQNPQQNQNGIMATKLEPNE